VIYKEEIERPRGILTPNDRRYLLDRDLPESRQGAYQQRKGARDRIKNGLLDISILQGLPREERRKIFEDMEQGGDLYWALLSAVVLAKGACDDAGLPLGPLLEQALEVYHRGATGEFDPYDDSEDSEKWQASFEETGHTKVLESVEVDIEYEYTDAYYSPRLRERFLEGQELTNQELLMLVNSDYFDEEAFEELQSRRAVGKDGED
jgi:hypothetical protein